MAVLVKPIVRLFFACDEAVLDMEDEKWTLKNPWHTVAMPQGVAEDFCQEEIWFYAQLTEGVGTFNLSVELRDEAGLRVGRSKPSIREFPGGMVMVEEVFQLTKMEFARPGLYEFVLLANHAELEGGRSYVRVLPG